MTGPAATAARDCMAVTNVAARPESPCELKLPAARVNSMGVSTAVHSPIPMQNPTSAGRVPALVNTLTTARNARARLGAQVRDHLPSSGASSTPVRRALIPPRPRRLPTAASSVSAVAAIGTSSTEKIVNGNRLTAAAASNGQTLAIISLSEDGSSAGAGTPCRYPPDEELTGSQRSRAGNPRSSPARRRCGDQRSLRCSRGRRTPRSARLAGWRWSDSPSGN